MKLGLGLYRHMLTPANFQFARQAGATHIVAHLVDYFRGAPDSHDQPTGADTGWVAPAIPTNSGRWMNLTPSVAT